MRSVLFIMMLGLHQIIGWTGNSEVNGRGKGKRKRRGVKGKEKKAMKIKERGLVANEVC